MAETKKRILAVDDATIFRMLVRELLERSGYEVESVATGEEAITRAQETHFDLIILDLLMPQPNGFDIFKRLKELCVTSRTPILILTVLGLESKIQALLQDGAHYLKKDEARVQLVSKVKEMIG